MLDARTKRRENPGREKNVKNLMWKFLNENPQNFAATFSHRFSHPQSKELFLFSFTHSDRRTTLIQPHDLIEDTMGALQLDPPSTPKGSPTARRILGATRPQCCCTIPDFAWPMAYYYLLISIEILFSAMPPFFFRCSFIAFLLRVLWNGLLIGNSHSSGFPWQCLVPRDVHPDPADLEMEACLL